MVTQSPSNIRINLSRICTLIKLNVTNTLRMLWIMVFVPHKTERCNSWSSVGRPFSKPVEPCDSLQVRRAIPSTDACLHHVSCNSHGSNGWPPVARCTPLTAQPTFSWCGDAKHRAGLADREFPGSLSLKPMALSASSMFTGKQETGIGLETVRSAYPINRSIGSARSRH